MTTENLNLEEWLPASVAARKLGTTELNALMLIKRGLLVGQEDADGWLIEPASFAALLKKHSGGALPPVCQSSCGKQAGGCGSCN